MNIIKASTGSPQDFAMALQDRIDELSGVASSTRIRRSRSVKCATGSARDFAAALQNRIDQLSGVDSSTNVTAATFVDPQGMFTEPGGTVTDAELKQYWDENQQDDQSLSDYATYEDWYADTVQWFTPATDDAAGYKVDQLAEAVCDALKPEFPDGDVMYTLDESNLTINIYDDVNEGNIIHSYIQPISEISPNWSDFDSDVDALYQAVMDSASGMVTSACNIQGSGMPGTVESDYVEDTSGEVSTEYCESVMEQLVDGLCMEGYNASYKETSLEGDYEITVNTRVGVMQIVIDITSFTGSGVSIDVDRELDSCLFEIQSFVTAHE